MALYNDVCKILLYSIIINYIVGSIDGIVYKHGNGLVLLHFDNNTDSQLEMERV